MILQDHMVVVSSHGTPTLSVGNLATRDDPCITESSTNPSEVSHPERQNSVAYLP